MKDVWLKHIRADSVIAFPRDYTLYRRKLLTTQQYLTSCDIAHKNRLELFTSVYSDYEVENQIVSELFYDIDVEHDVVELINKLERIISQVRAVYSGRRGIHIHVDVYPVVRVTDLRYVSMYVAEMLGIADIVDRQTLGDWRRLCRVPLSYHAATGNRVTVLNATTNPVLSRSLSELLSEKYSSRSTNYTVRVSDDVRETVTTLGEPPACVKFLLGQLESGHNLSHAARLHLGAYLMKLGLRPDEASVLFTKLPDYSPTVTQYQLDWLFKNRYNMYSCRRARELGLCPIQPANCPYYPSPNIFFR